MDSINNIVSQLYKKNKPLTVAVFLVIGALFSGFLFTAKTKVIEEKGILGGPDPILINSAQGAEVANSATVSQENTSFLESDEISASGEDVSPSTAVTPYLAAAVEDSGAAIGPALDRSGTISYKVQSGDTLSEIASYFGISLDSIVSANPGIRANSLRAGQNLTILPTSGVIYQAKSGDTLESISTEFDVPQSKLTQFNRSVNFSSLDAGTSIIIPGGTNADLLASNDNSLPNFNKDFVMPATGYDWGILHHYNAVDIANSCGTPVVASADGLVIPDPNIPDVVGAWNDGYGNFILLEHSFGNGVETRYAHLEKSLVQVGDYVKQGQEIGIMGETGDATGCHVHFEVIGAQNPFAKS